MKKFTKIVFCLGLICCLMVGFTSCENIFDVPLQEEDEPKKPEELKAYYIAVQVHDAGEVSTRAAFDSDFTDGGSGSYLFNNGLAAERAICPIDGFEKPEEGPHFLLFFDRDGNLTGHTALTDWKESEKGITDDPQPDYYTALAKLYIFIGGEEQTPIAFKNGKLLLVLNANKNLCNKINAIINDTQSNPNSKYERIYGLTVSNPVPASSGNIATVATLPETTEYLYLVHKGIRYYTMSSSIVIKNNEVVPANLPAEESITWYPSQIEAEKYPYSMYVERLQSKYTMLFQKGKDNNAKYYFFGDKDQTEENITYHHVDNKTALVYTSKTDFIPLDQFKKLKYVKSYIRSTSYADIKKVDVEETENWKVNITGWGLNGVEKTEYLFKHLTPLDNLYSSANWWKTEETQKYRNFWAEGTDYTSVSYPDQYRSITDEDNPKKLKGFKEIDYPSNNFLSYSSTRLREAHLYSPEHTFEASIFNRLSDPLGSKAHLRASTHIIVGAQLLIDGLDDSEVYTSKKVNHRGHIIKDNTRFEETTDVKCKVYMDGIYWDEDAYKEYVAEYLGYCLLSKENQDIFGPNDGNLYSRISPDPSNKAYAHAKDLESVPLNIEGGDGYICVNIKKDVGEDESDMTGISARSMYVYNPDIVVYDEEGKDITTEEDKYREITDAEFKTLVLQHPEFFGAHFYFSRMYYSIPVKHNIDSDSFKNNSLSSILTGDYGSVRNHWYYFTVNNINSPGTSVAVPDQPIVPNNEPLYETLGVNMKILNWHTVATDVDINDQLQNSGSSSN